MFIPSYIRDAGPKALEEYLDAQEKMFQLTEEQDIIRTKLEATDKELEGVYERKRVLMDKFPTLHFRRKYA